MECQAIEDTRSNGKHLSIAWSTPGRQIAYATSRKDSLHKFPERLLHQSLSQTRIFQRHNSALKEDLISISWGTLRFQCLLFRSNASDDDSLNCLSSVSKALTQTDVVAALKSIIGWSSSVNVRTIFCARPCRRVRCASGRKLILTINSLLSSSQSLPSSLVLNGCSGLILAATVSWGAHCAWCSMNVRY